MITPKPNYRSTMGEEVSQPNDDDGVRDLGSPFRMFSPADITSMFDMDFHPQPVSVRDVHPSELQEADPKDEESSSVQESAEDSTTLETSKSPAESGNPAPAEKESIPGLEDLVSSNGTSPGEGEQPVVTPPLPPGKTRSSQSAAK